MADALNELKMAVAENLIELRKKGDMTQLDLANLLNYSDKAVSKWERAESLPDVLVLKQIAAIFGVSVDYLLSSAHTQKEEEAIKPRVPLSKRAKALITGISMLLVWLIATASFVILDALPSTFPNAWLAFIFAIPASATVWLIFNAIWFDRKHSALIISILMWSGILSMHLGCFVNGIHIGLIYIIGVPGQAIILLWSVLRKKGKLR